jgi:hypothetical protein
MVNIEASLKTGGLTNLDFNYTKGHADYLTQRIGLESVSVGLESAATRVERTEIALEGLKEAVGKAVKAILEFLSRLWDAAVKFITGLSRHARELKKSFLALKGKEFDYTAEVVSKAGNKGKLFVKDGKLSSTAIKDAEEFVASFYSSKYSTSMVDFKLIGKLYIGVSVSPRNVIETMIDNFPMFLGNESTSHVEERGGVKEFVWKSPIDSFRIRAVIPDKDKIDDLMNARDYRKCGYYPVFNLDNREYTGSLKDLGITNVDALIPRLVSAVDEFEKKSNAWENAVTRNKVAQSVLKGMVDPSVQTFVAAALAPLGRCVVEPMRSMANVSYQMLYALEAMFRAAASSEKEVK